MQTNLVELKEVWRLLFPNIAAPADHQWALWLLLHDLQIVKDSIAELAKKYRTLNGQMDADYMVRFASSVMNRKQSQKTLA